MVELLGLVIITLLAPVKSQLIARLFLVPKFKGANEPIQVIPPLMMELKQC